MHKRFIKVTGTARERGRQIGEQLKDEIMTNYLNQKEYYRAGEDFDYEKWEEMSKRYIPMMETWTPGVLEEMQGMAEGAGVDYLKVLALTTAYEKSFGRDMISDKCTSFFVTGEAAHGGKTIAAQTNDEKLTEWLHELDVVIHHKAEDGHEVMAYTHPGIPAYMGMNNSGLAVLWTYIDNGMVKDGVPTNGMIRQLLEYKDIEEAVSFLEQVPHEVPNHFGLADKYGHLISVECFPNKVYVVREKNAFTHTNHNVYAVDEPECTCGKTTWDRLAVVKEMVESNWGKIDAQMAKDFLKSHERYPNCICVHPVPERPWNKTLAAMVFELDEGVMNIAFGNPCEIPYREFRFDNYL